MGLAFDERRRGRPTNAEIAARQAAKEMPAVRRWLLSDLDPWLLGRLNFRWNRSEAMWRGLLAGFVASSDFLFITNEHAVLLAVRMRHEISGDQIIKEIIAFARDADEKDGVYEVHLGTIGDAALRLLYRSMRDWGKSMNAARAYVGVCSDILPSKLKETMGDAAYYLVAGPC